MRYRIYSEENNRYAVEWRLTAEGAVVRAQYLVERGAAGVEIWDNEMPDRIYLPWQFDELLPPCFNVGREE